MIYIVVVDIIWNPVDDSPPPLSVPCPAAFRDDHVNSLIWSEHFMDNILWLIGISSRRAVYIVDRGGEFIVSGSHNVNLVELLFRIFILVSIQSITTSTAYSKCREQVTISRLPCWVCTRGSLAFKADALVHILIWLCKS